MIKCTLTVTTYFFFLLTHLFDPFDRQSICSIRQSYFHKAYNTNNDGNNNKMHVHARVLDTRPVVYTRIRVSQVLGHIPGIRADCVFTFLCCDAHSLRSMISTWTRISKILYTFYASCTTCVSAPTIYSNSGRFEYPNMVQHIFVRRLR